MALAAAALSYYLVENPVRHLRFRRHRRMAPIALGVVLTALSLAVATVELDVHQGSAAEISVANEQAAATATVTALVSKSIGTRTLPADLTPTLAGVAIRLGRSAPAVLAGHRPDHHSGLCLR